MAKTLEDILEGYKYQIISGSIQTEINLLQSDSRKVKEGDVFVALQGTQVDGHNYINKALDSGAAAIVCTKCPQLNDVTVVQVDDTQDALAFMAHKFFDEPSSKLVLVGVTGTNGKTTVATSLYRFFQLLGIKTGLISTIKYIVDKEELPATHTTPEPVMLNMMLDKMVKAGCKYAFMEVSSHAVCQKRIEYLAFDGAVFTNITHDHLDYHKTFKNYINAKKKFFDKLPNTAFALVNQDDRNGSIMVQNTAAKVYTYALKQPADFKAKIIEKHLNGTLALIDGHEVWLNFAGRFNIYNLLAIYAVAVLLGQDKLDALRVLSLLRPVDGRFEIISGNELTAIVDYAHTPDALEKILLEVKDLSAEGRLIVVFGAGGNRDAAKRPKMGAIAAKLADKIIVTSDNPRFEQPQKIIEDIVHGIPVQLRHKLLVIEDREQAVKTAVEIASKGDVIVIAGKGHETYQEINGERIHFDDREVVQKFINQKRLN